MRWGKHQAKATGLPRELAKASGLALLPRASPLLYVLVVVVVEPTQLKQRVESSIKRRQR
jgi:hypothetical protein